MRERGQVRTAFLLTAISLVLAPVLSAQGSEPRGRFEFIAYALWSIRDDVADADALGGEVGLAYRVGAGVGVELRASYRRWESDPETVIPLHLGVRYDLRLHSRIAVIPFIGFGPALVVGNDWGSVFADFDAGMKAVAALGSKLGLALGASYARGMAFHPNEFGYVNVFGGVEVVF
jgi:hypothetical protein